MNLRNLPARIGTSLVAVIGIGGVVAVLVSLLSMGEGFRAALDLSGSEDVALVLRGGSSDELSSAFDREQVNVIVSAPGIRRDALGPVASPEFYTIVDLPMRSTGTAAIVPFRGVTSRATDVRTGFRIVAGRMFEPGKDEVIVGRGAFAQFGNVDLGREVKWGSHVWRVVGVFEAGGSISESDLYYLSHDSLAPSEIARRLQLRPPTVTHHLKELRLASLVELSMTHEENRYTVRKQALENILRKPAILS